MICLPATSCNVIVKWAIKNEAILNPGQTENFYVIDRLIRNPYSVSNSIVDQVSLTTVCFGSFEVEGLSQLIF